MANKKTCTIEILCKDPDAFDELAEKLRLSETKRDKFLEFGEYARIELVVDSDMNITSGKFLPYK